MSDEEDDKNDTDHSENSQPEPDAKKLENLIKRQKCYGDITQNASEAQLERLLVSKTKAGTIFWNTQYRLDFTTLCVSFEYVLLINVILSSR